MTERERLTERARLAECIRSAMCRGWTEPSDIAERLIDEGIIVPPCKVGDTVYYMHNGGGRVYEGVVTSFIYVSDTKSFGIHCDGIYGKYGVYVFPTREEAEAALAERRKA